MADEIELAGRDHQYMDPEDGDYINSETGLFYLPDTDEFRMVERESYLYGGETLRRDSIPISKEEALSFLTYCASDRSSYHGIEMAPDEEMPTARISNSKEALEIIDNLRHEVHGNFKPSTDRQFTTIKSFYEQGKIAETDFAAFYEKPSLSAARDLLNAYPNLIEQLPEIGKRSTIKIKAPDAPASEAQMGLLNALAENGVVTHEEMASLGDSPTKQAASDLISAHSMDDGFKAVQEARRAQRTTAKPQHDTAVKQSGTGKNSYVTVKIPAAFLTPHEYTAKSGRTFEKLYVNFPEGTKVNGVDLSHYSCDVFLNDRMKQQMVSGEKVGISFKADEPVQVWTGKAGDEQHPYKKLEVKPWDLKDGIDTAFDGFKAKKAAEREAAKEQRVTLKGEYEQMRGSSAALAGDHAQGDRPVTR